MKRLWVILGALAVICALSVTEASAQRFAGAGWKVERLNFRSNAAANPAPGWVDSSSFNRLQCTGAGITVANAETTTVISTDTWFIPVGPIADSTTVFAVFLSDAGGTSSAVDSVHIAAQVSADGTNWVYVSQLANGAGQNPVTLSVPVGAAVWSIPNAAGLTTATPKVFTKRFVKAVLNTGQYADVGNFFYWPYMRFIVLNDHRDAGGTRVNLSLSVGHWTARGES